MDRNEKKKRQQEYRQRESQSFHEKLIASNIKLFPNAIDVFENSEMVLYFKPLLTHTHLINGKEYFVHLLGTDGLYLENPLPYAEGGLWGFDYNNGKYRFKGDLKTFGTSNVQEVYSFLKNDFEINKDNYIQYKVSEDKYLENICERLAGLAKFSDKQDVEYYASAFYSYEFNKYYYENEKRFCHITEITENFAHNKEDILFSKCNMENVIDEFFINIEYTLKNPYTLSCDMVCCGTDGHRFMSLNGLMVFGFLDVEQEIVYILEYGS